MAVRIPYTHGYDRVLTFLRLLAYLTWFIIVLSTLYALGGLLTAMGIDSLLDALPGWLNVVFIIGLFLGCLMLTVYLHSITTNRWIGNLSAWLYIRGTLKTRLSFGDAAKISWLFVPNETGKWYPMKEVLRIPQESRRDYLLTRAREIAGLVAAEQDRGEQQPAQRRG
jgi:hypothetical protein